MKIIFDLQYQEMLSLPLTEVAMNRLPGLTWVNICYDNLTHRGYEVSLSSNIDRFEDVKGAILISDMYTAYTDKLISRGAIAHLVFSMESPNISKSFYSTYSSKYNYNYSYLFPGIFSFFGNGKQNLPLFWPNAQVSQHYKNKHKDVFLGMIASNKQMFNRRFKFIPGIVERTIKKAVWSSYYDRLNKMNYADLYKNRLEAIVYFSEFKDFALFGRGWDKQNTLSLENFNHIQKIKPQEIDDKLETLSRMKFSICFENFRFPGYITEKIFDCFFTGTVPIYLGAPDIENYVPTNCFVDASQFGSFSEMNDFIRSMSSEKIKELLENANDFLNSSAYEKFTDRYFANQILNSIN